MSPMAAVASLAALYPRSGLLCLNTQRVANVLETDFVSALPKAHMFVSVC